MAKLSNDRLPTAFRLTRWFGSVVVPARRSMTLIGAAMLTGSRISYSPPVAPASSATMMVPHGVRLTGSHDERPVTIVVAFDAAGFDRSTRCTAGFEVSSSQTNKYFGLSSSGQSAIWSAADATELETSETCRPWATTIACRLSAPSYGPIADSVRG